MIGRVKVNLTRGEKLYFRGELLIIPTIIKRGEPINDCFIE